MEIKEYKIMSMCCDDEENEKILNEYAEDGWKLICADAEGSLFLERNKNCKEESN